MGPEKRDLVKAQLELVGVNNIVCNPIPDEEDEKRHEDEEVAAKETTDFQKDWIYCDVAQSITNNIPTIKARSPEIIWKHNVINKRKAKIRLINRVTIPFFKLRNIHIGKRAPTSPRQAFL